MPQTRQLELHGKLHCLLEAAVENAALSLRKSLSTRKFGQCIPAMNINDRSSLQRRSISRELKTPRLGYRSKWIRLGVGNRRVILRDYRLTPDCWHQAAQINLDTNNRRDPMPTGQTRWSGIIDAVHSQEVVL